MLQFEYEKDTIVNCKVGKSIIMARIEDIKHNIDNGKTLVVVSDGQDLYNLNPEDIIGKHMFPLNITPPKYIESWIVTISDKIISLSILAHPKEYYKYLGIKRRI